MHLTADDCRLVMLLIETSQLDEDKEAAWELHNRIQRSRGMSIVTRDEAAKFFADTVGHTLMRNALYDYITQQRTREAEQQAEIERLKQELNLASVGEAGAQSANRHLSALVDFERQVSGRCMAVMKSLMEAAEPLNNDHQDCFINYADWAKFVDAHAELLYVIANGKKPDGAALNTERAMK